MVGLPLVGTRDSDPAMRPALDEVTSEILRVQQAWALPLSPNGVQSLD